MTELGDTWARSGRITAYLIYAVGLVLVFAFWEDKYAWMQALDPELSPSSIEDSAGNRAPLVAIVLMIMALPQLAIVVVKEGQDRASGVCCVVARRRCFGLGTVSLAARGAMSSRFRSAVLQLVALSTECRLIVLSVIEPPATSLEHLVRLRHWTDPLGLPVERLTLHAVEAAAPAEVIIEFARRNNVDLVVLGAPSEGGRAWSQSVASAVTARVRCSTYVVRARKA
jgi:hypothetical protein